MFNIIRDEETGYTYVPLEIDDGHTLVLRCIYGYESETINAFRLMLQNKFSTKIIISEEQINEVFGKNYDPTSPEFTKMMDALMKAVVIV